MAWSRRRAAWLRIPSCRQIGFGSPGAAYPPPLIQKRFISDISHVETQTLNLILDPPLSDTPYFFRRNRNLGTISVCMGYVTSAVYPPSHMCIHGKNICIVR